MNYKFEDLNDIEYVKKNPIVTKIDGFDYEVDTDGNVYNDRGMIMKPSIVAGYPIVFLRKDGQSYQKYIHRLVADAFIENSKNKKCVDHIDNKKTNNNVYNLRWATHQENQFNRSMLSTNTSGIKGVAWHKKLKKWVAHINVDKKQYHIGCFKDIGDAKRARQIKAREVFGAYINNCETVNIIVNNKNN